MMYLIYEHNFTTQISHQSSIMKNRSEYKMLKTIQPWINTASSWQYTHTNDENKDMVETGSKTHIKTETANQRESTRSEMKGGQ